MTYEAIMKNADRSVQTTVAQVTQVYCVRAILFDRDK